MSMEALYFWVDAVPVPKARPRLGKGGHVYTPETTRDFEGAVKRAFRRAHPGTEPLAGPVGVRVDVYCAGAGEWHKIRGDADNYLKAVCDALNKEAWVDDIQVVMAEVRKWRAPDDAHVGVLVEICAP